jgi:HAD superfamily hydrolase (TIGR01509 family)
VFPAGTTTSHRAGAFSDHPANHDDVQAVYFDLDGTVVELPDDFAGLFESALAEHAIEARSQHREYYFDAFFEHLGESHPEPYRMAMADLREAFDLEPDAEALAETYTGRETAATSLRPGVRETLDTLDGSDAPDCRFGILTNGGARAQRRKLEYHGIAGQFDAAVVSGDVGAGKPDSEIFAAAKDAISADQYVFVADDLERDVLPAQEAGFTGVYLAADAEPTDADRADEIVASLSEVPGVLD